MLSARYQMLARTRMTWARSAAPTYVIQQAHLTRIGRLPAPLRGPLGVSSLHLRAAGPKLPPLVGGEIQPVHDFVKRVVDRHGARGMGRAVVHRGPVHESRRKLA